MASGFDLRGGKWRALDVVRETAAVTGRPYQAPRRAAKRSNAPAGAGRDRDFGKIGWPDPLPRTAVRDSS
jgi:hypothetical protein